MSRRVAVIAGDGVGKEVIPVGVEVVSALVSGIDFEPVPWGCEYYERNGRMMPEDGLKTLAAFDAIYLGAIGWPTVPDHLSLWGLLLPIRKTFEQYVNVRPVRLLPGVRTPLAGRGPEDIDMLVYRENTEGEYAPVGGRLYQGTPAEVAINTSVFTRRGCERIMHAAFAGARKRKKRVTSITKSNAQGFTLGLWDDAFSAVAKEYPDVESHSLLVDAAAMDFVRRPEAFDVVVASNLFGDILTDLSAIVTGSMGLAASANLDPTRRHPSMFEPVHGSAPDIAGKGRANPIGAVWSAAMMLDHLGEPDAARRVERAIDSVTDEGVALTADLGGTASTKVVGAAILAALRR